MANTSSIASMLVVLCGLGSASVMAVTINDSVDRFTGVRTITWAPAPSGPEEFALNSAIFKTADPATQILKVELITYADRQQYESCNHVYWLADGKQVAGLDTVYSAEFGKSVVIERFKLEADDRTFQTLAAAKKVEFKVCNTEKVVSDNDLSGFKAVYAKSVN